MCIRDRLRTSPYGATNADGYLTLSLYRALRNLVNADRPILKGVTNVINYGLNKVRLNRWKKLGAVKRRNNASLAERATRILEI